MFDFIHNNLPKTFDSTWLTNDRFRERELRNDNLFHIPRLRYKYLSNHPFVYYPQIWNELSDNLKLQNRKSKFCIDFKKISLIKIEIVIISHIITCKYLFCSLLY